jgi:hypothetical protein
VVVGILGVFVDNAGEPLDILGLKVLPKGVNASPVALKDGIR